MQYQPTLGQVTPTPGVQPSQEAGSDSYADAIRGSSSVAEAIQNVVRLRDSTPQASQTSQIHIDPSQAMRGDQGASKLLGQLNRAQWSDWRSRFAPYVDELARVAQDNNAPGMAASNASNAVGLAYDSSQQGLGQQRQGYGISQTPQQQAAEERRTSLERSASMVSAGNQARISAQDRQQAILAGGMGLSNIPDRVMNQ